MVVDFIYITRDGKSPIIYKCIVCCYSPGVVVLIEVVDIHNQVCWPNSDFLFVHSFACSRSAHFYEAASAVDEEGISATCSGDGVSDLYHHVERAATSEVLVVECLGAFSGPMESETDLMIPVLRDWCRDNSATVQVVWRVQVVVDAEGDVRDFVIDGPAWDVYCHVLPHERSGIGCRDCCSRAAAVRVALGDIANSNFCNLSLSSAQFPRVGRTSF